MVRRGLIKEVADAKPSADILYEKYQGRPKKPSRSPGVGRSKMGRPPLPPLTPEEIEARRLKRKQYQAEYHRTHYQSKHSPALSAYEAKRAKREARIAQEKNNRGA